MEEREGLTGASFIHSETDLRRAAQPCSEPAHLPYCNVCITFVMQAEKERWF